MLVFGCRDDDVRPASGSVFAHSPAFILDTTFSGGNGELALRFAGCNILGRIKFGKMLAEDFARVVALETFGTHIPTGDLTIGIQRKNRIILNSFHQ